MKRFFMILFFIVGFISGRSYSQNYWKWIAPYPNGNPFYSMSLAGSYTYFLANMGTLSVTRDGGKTVENLPVYTKSSEVGYAGTYQQRLAFADSLNGFLLDALKGSFRTSDGGYHWTLLNGGTAANIVTFADSHTGWKYDNGNLYKTVDAGNSWKVIPSPVAQDYTEYPSAVYAPDSMNLWIISTYNPYKSKNVRVYYSSDGGNSWGQQPTGFITDSLKRVDLHDVRVNRSGTGILIGSVSEKYSHTPGIPRSIIYRTTDFGKKWNVVDTLVRGDISRIISVNDSIWVLHGFGENSLNMTLQMRSTDFGKTFDHRQVLAPDFSNQFYYSSIYSPAWKTIFISTWEGLYRSIDYGVTYSKITSENDIHVTDFAIDNNTTGPQLAAAISFQRNSYLISEDGGRSWRRKELNNNDAGITGVYAESGVLYLATYGKVFISTDKGNNWREATFPRTTDYNYAQTCFSAYDTTNFLAYGEAGSPTLNYSTDGGRSWMKSPFAQNYHPGVMRLTSAGDVTGCGGYWDSDMRESGFIFTGSSGGASWHITQTNDWLIDMGMTSSSTGYCYSHYSIYTTKDNWKTKQTVYTYNDNRTYIYAVTFSDALHGLVCNYDHFSETSNGGITWTENNLAVPMSMGIKKMAFNNNGDLLALGDKGLMINLNTGSKNNSAAGSNDSKMNTMLSQNYPNPFNPATKITFSLKERAGIELKVYDILGRAVRSLAEGTREAGTYTVEFNASDLPSGIYICRLKAGDQMFIRKMLMMK